MDMTPVACNNCGAALHVPESARFVTCRYCKSQLEVKRADSVVTTEVLRQISDNTAAIAEDLQAIRLESELERLDREWRQRHASLSSRNEDGSIVAPSAAMGYLAMFVMGGFGLAFTIIAAAMSGVFSLTILQTEGPAKLFAIFPCIFPLFGLFFMALSIFLGIRTIKAAKRFQLEQQQYLEQRQRLLAALSAEPAHPTR